MRFALAAVLLTVPFLLFACCLFPFRRYPSALAAHARVARACRRLAGMGG